MDNVITISDSTLETTGMLEDLSSHKGISLADLSLNESTIYDENVPIGDESNCLDTSPASVGQNYVRKLRRSTSLHSPSSCTSMGKDFIEQRSHKPPEMCSTSTKEDKERLNEEIVILESSSLSSETGSWESVFLSKLPERDLCEKFINIERKNALGTGSKSKTYKTTNLQDGSHDTSNLVQKSPLKSTSCFIDAASLGDDCDSIITVNSGSIEPEDILTSDILPQPNPPVPCVFQRDQSPNDWSGSNDNEDSLEQAEKKDLTLNSNDTIYKELSPITKSMYVTEDSLSSNVFATTLAIEHHCTTMIQKNAISTPNNSMIFVGRPNFKQGNDHLDIHFGKPQNISLDQFAEECNSSLINNEYSLDDRGTVDYRLSQGSSHGSLVTKRKIENIPIVSEAYIPGPEEISEKPHTASSNAAYWVVDMSLNSKFTKSGHSTKEINKKIDIPMATLASKPTSSVENCKSRSSVDSDSSEKSTHKFYIDLSTLPDTLALEQRREGEAINEKKNIFSMFIDLDDKSTAIKEMPARLSSSLNVKKSTKNEEKSSSKHLKTSKASSLTCVTNVTTHTDDSIFEKLETLCDDPSISISEIISNPDSHTEDELSNVIRKTKETATKIIIEESVHDEALDLFVKLSDLDKPMPKPETVIVPVKQGVTERMTRSIPDNNWRESGQTINLRSSDIISSFHSENALSLNRLFPHLNSDFSRSMPGSLSSRTKSPLKLGVSPGPGEIDEQASDMSEMSSVQSSCCRSVVENSTTEDTDQISSLISSCQSRLGQDLLRMFLEEIAPDVIVEVSGRRIKAHKCILSSRCQYFAGILSGGWVESAGNVMSLPAFSFSVVHFALCHIYSGVSMIPDSISIVELATLADMLGLEGLKEAIMFTLKSKYCHNFHKPCAVCTAGVLECFPMTSLYGLDDLYRKCLRWITKYFHRVWPTKAFATLPSELLDKCYQEHIVNFTADNIVETVYGCGLTVASLQSSRWAEVVARMCRRLENAAAHFAASRLCGVLRVAAAKAPDAPPPALKAFDDCMAAAIERAPPDEACRAYAFLCSPAVYAQRHAKLTRNVTSTPSGAPEPSLLSTRANEWRLRCEDALVRAAPRVIGTHAFMELPADLRKRLRELGCVMLESQASPASASPQPPRSALGSRAARKSHTPGKRCASATSCLDIDVVRTLFVPYAPKPQPQISSIDSKSARDLKRASFESTSKAYKAPSVRTTKAQEERAKYNLKKTNPPQNRSNGKKISARAEYEKAQAQYLEPRLLNSQEKKKIPSKQPQPPVESSSESSRNASPLQKRAARAMRRAASLPRTADPSTDSLTESQNSNKNANKTCMSPSVRTTKAQEERANYNSIKTNRSQDQLNGKGRPASAAYVNTKPRYLEPRLYKLREEKKKPPKQSQPPVESSSESSRNLSPLQKRTANTAGRALAAALLHTPDPSTGSLTESQNSNKYATYTKAKHTIEGSVESVGIQPQNQCHPDKSFTNKKLNMTKIPVYLNQNSKSCNIVSGPSRKIEQRVQNFASLSPILQSRHKVNERKPSGSLMNATKSSQAKMVPKIVKETTNIKYAAKQEKLKCDNHNRSQSPPAPEIPVMERSGTFVKNEPSFGEKTTDIDKDSL